MRVLHIITGLAKGGAEGVLVRLILNDVKNQHHVICLTPGGYWCEILKSKSITVDRLNFSSFHNYIILKIKNIVKTLRPDELKLVV